jgi:hypothetical protein
MGRGRCEQRGRREERRDVPDSCVHCPASLSASSWLA